MSMLRKYLEETERKYHYRIKTVVPLDDAAMDRIESAVLAKYVPLSVGNVEKTIFQRHPLDFPGIDNAEVYWVDVTLGMSASSYILQQDIRAALGIPEKFIVVRGENEPTEVETQRINAVADMEKEAAEKGLKPAALLDHPDYPEADDVKATDYYGDEYNSRLTDYLKKLQDERDLEVRAANAPKPFDWLEREPKQDEADYNADIKGAPAAASVRKKSAKTPPIDTAKHGNLDNNDSEHKRVFADKKGDRKVLSKTGTAVKK